MRHYGVLGGSDLVKIMEQLGRTVITDYDYVVAHTNGELIGTQSLKSFLGEDKLKEFINFTLHYIADLDIPIKRLKDHDMEFSSSRLYFIAQRAFELLKESTSMELEATPDDEVFSSNDEVQELWPLGEVDPKKARFPCCTVWTPLLHWACGDCLGGWNCHRIW
ncbi:uncharacterized protein LOC120648990 isoform X2 [Panicum virgatum]|uniref:uncharacterized protein LOC120648990 isoform X2 n=1 Tax=Panicum virgatum TaxID=38727 RepID=UPI0019D59E30|nr:uncharacterized protein LOC120648990 isoform X2 [Panicum virgatum]